MLELTCASSDHKSQAVTIAMSNKEAIGAENAGENRGTGSQEPVPWEWRRGEQLPPFWPEAKRALQLLQDVLNAPINAQLPHICLSEAAALQIFWLTERSSAVASLAGIGYPRLYVLLASLSFGTRVPDVNHHPQHRRVYEYILSEREAADPLAWLWRSKQHSNC